MDNKASLEAMLHLAAVELDEAEYREFKERERKNKLEKPREEFAQKMQSVMDREKKFDNFRHFRRRFYKAAVIFLVSFSFVSMSFLSVSAVRKSVADVILEWYDGFTRIFMINEESETVIGDVEFGYIPDGFVMTGKDEEFNSSKKYEFSHTNKNYYYVQITVSGKNSFMLADNDRLNYHNIVIDEISGIWTENAGYNQVIISDCGITYDIGGCISLSEIIKIYKNIKIL